MNSNISPMVYSLPFAPFLRPECTMTERRIWMAPYLVWDNVEGHYRDIGVGRPFTLQLGPNILAVRLRGGWLEKMELSPWLALARRKPCLIVWYYMHISGIWDLATGFPQRHEHVTVHHNSGQDSSSRRTVWFEKKKSAPTALFWDMRQKRQK
jgi:hypothetical protein